MFNKTEFITIDNNYIINIQCISWIKKMDECLQICTKKNGCTTTFTDTHKLCKINNLNSYNKLNKLFDEKK